MFLSIIIPAKNEEKQLPLLLGSIKRQSFKDLEVIVADAASTDRTREVARSFGAKVVEGGMPGPGRNRGAEAAGGEILLFLDADVLLPEDFFLQKALEEIKRKNFCATVPLYDFYSARMMDKIVALFWNTWVTIVAGFNPSAGGSCIFAKKEAHDKIGGFNEKIILGEDTDYVYRISRVCRFGIIKSVRVQNSPRRLHKEGYMKVFSQAVSAGFYRYVLRRKDYGNNFNYNFDIYETKRLL